MLTTIGIEALLPRGPFSEPARGVLAVRAAAHSPVGSSPNLMARLARACVGQMLRGDMLS